MYSCWWCLAALVQSFHVTGWSNFTQLATNLYGRALLNTSRVASLLRSYPAFLAVVANWAMKPLRSSPFILRSLILCWAFCFSTVSVYAWQNLVSMVVHRFSSAWGTPPVTWSMSHCACSSTQSFTMGPWMYDKNVMLL